MTLRRPPQLAEAAVGLHRSSYCNPTTTFAGSCCCGCHEAIAYRGGLAVLVSDHNEIFCPCWPTWHETQFLGISMYFMSLCLIYFLWTCISWIHVVNLLVDLVQWEMIDWGIKSIWRWTLDHKQLLKHLPIML